MKFPKISISFGWRVLLVVLLTVATIGGYFLYASVRSTTVVINLPYDQAERRLFSALKLNKDQLIAGKLAQSNVSGELEKSLKMGIHTHHLIDYIPGNHVHFWGDHAYNFFGSGHEWIEFDLVSKDEKSSTLTVDYFENTRLGAIPMTWQSGRKQEWHIITTVFGEDAQ